MSETARPRDPSFAAADLDLDLVADDLADALDPVDAAALHALLARDPAARARHDELADALDGVAAVLAAQPHPALPDHVLIRVDAALGRESAARAAGSQPAGSPSSSVAMRPQKTPVPRTALQKGRWRRAFGPWAGGLLGTAAVVGGLFLALHTLAGNSSSSTTSAASAASEPARAAAGASAPGAAPLTSAVPGFGVPDLAGAPVLVTASSLGSVVQGLLTPPTGKVEPAPLSGWASAGDTPSRPSTAAAPSTAGDLCLPAGLPASAIVVASRPVTFRGAPARLLVLHEQGAPARVVRAEVFRTCGSAVLLTGTVTLAR